MAEHCELVAEMATLEAMGTQERQKQAKKRRLQQLKKWGQREKEWMSKEKQLNKRLSVALAEENNGLNLKQYTTYSSSHRSRKRSQAAAAAAAATKCSSQQDYLNNNNNNNNQEPAAVVRVAPSGRVHFNVGVMLLEAASRNDFSEVKRLLMLGVSPDSVNHDGLTALHQCCIDASEPMMQLLLDFGANVDAKDTEQWTPLHAACTCGHLNLVRVLVEHGANLLAVNGDGNMPFDICDDDDTLDYIETQMVEQGITQEMIDCTRASAELNMLAELEALETTTTSAPLNAPINPDTGVTPLHVAAANGYARVVEFLLARGAQVSVCDSDRWQPLHGAACWGAEQHVRVVELLVEAGASLEARTGNDETVFDLCDNPELLERLNQLKDELESKQQAAAAAAAASQVVEPLKRTQSRTNSRVHSVRRTSVRDKNQISRREAREEAMLRVDSGTNIAPSTTTTNGHSQVPATGRDSLSSSEAHREEPPAHDQVDGQSTQVCQTDLDANEPLSTCSNELQTTSLQKPDITLDSINNNHSSSSSINEKKLLNGTAGNKCHHTKSNPTDNKSNRLQDNNNDTNSLTTKSNCDSLAASSDGASNAQSAPKHSHPAPTTTTTTTNYTLANLKKQRSDLRMRTTSLGGGVSNTVNSNPDNNNYLANGAGAGTGRSDSPSVSFRKFRGAPSELVGGLEKGSEHRCCILM